MKLDQPLALLGGISAQEFMSVYWQRKPLLIRRAFSHFKSSLTPKDIRELVSREEVESRLIWQTDTGWHMQTGPFDTLPPTEQAGWSVLAQSVDLHDDATAELLRHFRFIPDARIDDIMMSLASDGGGVGPHFDSYDVFLLQGYGRRRWRISQQKDLSVIPALPLKILQNFQPEEQYLLEPGDMLYLPPHVAHEGVAIGANCITLSIGFRAPTLATLAHGVLDAAADQLAAQHDEGYGLYSDPPIAINDLQIRYTDSGSRATLTPAALPEKMIRKALAAVRQIDFTEHLASRFLGVWLSSPPANADFIEQTPEHDLLELNSTYSGLLKLDRCTRLLYGTQELYINGEVAPCPPSEALRNLADRRQLKLHSHDFQTLASHERSMLNDWLQQGWLTLHAVGAE